MVARGVRLRCLAVALSPLPLVALAMLVAMALLVTLTSASCSLPGATDPAAGLTAVPAGTRAMQDDRVTEAWTPEIGAPLRGPVVVGAVRDTENIVAAELYAQVLEAAGFDVLRQFNFARATDATDAMLAGHIDLVAQRPSIAARSVLGLSETPDVGEAPRGGALYDTVAAAYATFDVLWLRQAASDSGDGVAPLVRTEVLEYFPELATTLNEASVRLSDAGLAELVAAVERERREPREVVAVFLAAPSD